MYIVTLILTFGFEIWRKMIRLRLINLKVTILAFGISALKIIVIKNLYEPFTKKKSKEMKKPEEMKHED